MEGKVLGKMPALGNTHAKRQFLTPVLLSPHRGKMPALGNTHAKRQLLTPVLLSLLNVDDSNFPELM